MKLPRLPKIIEQGEHTASLLLPSDVQVDLLVMDPESYGAALQHFTGSKFHNIALREHAKKLGYSLNEYGAQDIKKFKASIIHVDLTKKKNSIKDIHEAIGKKNKEIEKKILVEKLKPHKFSILSPIIRDKKGEFKELFDNLRSKGLNQIIVDGKIFNLNDEINLIKSNKHNIEVVMDTISFGHREMKNNVFQANLRSRLVNSVEQSLNLSDGLVILKTDKNQFLFSEKFSCPVCNLSLPEIEPRMFSFNSPLGACENCRGIGTIFAVDRNLILNKNLSILEGGILPFNKLFFHETWYVRLIKQVCEEEGVDMNKPISQLTDKQLKILLEGTDKIYRVNGVNRYGRSTTITEKFTGIIDELERRYIETQGDYMAMEIKKYMREETCPKCQGQRLKPEILSITIDKNNITKISDQSIDNLINYFKEKLESVLSGFEKQVAKPIIKEILTRLNFLNNVGLLYLTVSRRAGTLSGGELQRIRLASQIGSGLTGVLYVLDEPSIGLHPKDVASLITTLKKLRDLGNSLIIVEHDRETIELNWEKRPVKMGER